MGSGKFRKAFDGMNVRQTPYTLFRQADPARDKDLHGNPVPPEFFVFVRRRDCKKVGPPGANRYYDPKDAPSFPITYVSPRHGYTDWEFDGSYWYFHQYCIMEGKVHVGTRRMKVPPEDVREKIFREKGIIISATGTTIR